MNRCGLACKSYTGIYFDIGFKGGLHSSGDHIFKIADKFVLRKTGTEFKIFTLFIVALHTGAVVTMSAD